MVVRARLLFSDNVAFHKIVIAVFFERTVFGMTPQNKLKVVYGIVIYLLFVGVLCYAAFPVNPPEEPVRLMFKVTAGKVLYDHQTHTSESGYGLSCWDCHHHPMDDDSALIACGACHFTTDGEVLPPEVCNDCHDPDEIEDTELIKRSEAFHQGCIGCHEEFEAGPSACASCHVMS
jgi:hypothetical protein